MAQFAAAQIGGTGVIQGTVSDPTGAVIPDATVTATNIATNVKTSRQTTGAGLYVLSPLPPGEYTVEVTAPGFQRTVQQHVFVDALGTVRPRPSRTRLTNSPASSITSLPLVSLMTKPSLPSLKLATRNADSVNCNPSHGKWVTQSWRQPCDLQFLERGVSESSASSPAELTDRIRD